MQCARSRRKRVTGKRIELKRFRLRFFSSRGGRLPNLSVVEGFPIHHNVHEDIVQGTSAPSANKEERELNPGKRRQQ